MDGAPLHLKLPTIPTINRLFPFHLNGDRSIQLLGRPFMASRVKFQIVVVPASLVYKLILTTTHTLPEGSIHRDSNLSGYHFKGLC
jgi:hypothetical protein